MGIIESAICTTCGHTWKQCVGGGFSFWPYHCNRCHEASNITWSDLDRLPDSEPESEHRVSILGLDDAQAELLLGRCTCGGRFSANARIRCPECDLDTVELEGEPSVHFD